MDLKVLDEWNDHYDSKFAKEHPDFEKWWRTHAHCDRDPKWAVAPRIAWKCAAFRQEYLEAREVGII